FFFAFLTCDLMYCIVCDGLSYISKLMLYNSFIDCCHLSFLLLFNLFGLRVANELICPIVAINRLNRLSFDISNENISGTAPFSIAPNANLSIVAVLPMLGRAPMM